MEILAKKYFVLTVSNKVETLLARSENESLKPLDLVHLKGREGVYTVLSTDFVSEEELPMLPPEMEIIDSYAEKEVIESRSLAAMEKASEEEHSLQAKEEEEEALEEEEEPEEEPLGPEESLYPDDLSLRIKMDSSFSLLSYETDLALRLLDRAKKRKEEKTGYAFIEEIALDNHSSHTLRGLTLRISFTSKLLSCEEILLPALEKGERLILSIPFIKVDKEGLMHLDEPLPSSMNVELFSPGGKKILGQEKTFLILPIGEKNHFFDSDYRLLAKYVTPNAEEVRQLTLDALLKTPRKSFLAYQNADLNDRAAELGAMFVAIAEKGIAYQNPVATSSPYQRIRMPAQVLKDHKGTCIDLSILYAACLEEIGYHPILIVTDTHALIGVFLNENDHFENARLNKFGAFYNRISGKGDILVIDAVNLSNGEISFPRAVRSGNERLRNYAGSFFSAIDIHSAHKSVFLPISSSSSLDELDPSSLYRRASEERFEPLVEHKYTEIRHENSKDRFTFWENKLLDLTEKNPLVSFHFGPNNFVKLVKKDLPFALREEKPIPLRFLETPSTGSRAEQVEAILKSDVASLPFGADSSFGYLFGKERQFRSILSKNQSEIEETGAPTLYLCLGLLTFATEEIRKGDFKRAHAPFLLLPIKIERKGFGSSSYVLSYDYDDIMLNKTWFEFYKLEHPDFDMSPLYEITSSDRYEDIVATFKDHVEEDVKLDESTFFIANLTFSHYIMWLDMRKRKEELKENKIIASIVEGESKLDKKTISLESVEKAENYLDFAAPLPYDSTQLAAILEAGEGKSFILDGPPGTGKSQTIVNVIVNAIYHGKSVLFVAEKKAALDVVAERLRKIKLDRFCLELHSSKANKRDFFSRLAESMKLGPTIGAGDFRHTVAELESSREEIRKTIRAMHECKKYALSFFEAIVLDMNLNTRTRYFELPVSLIEKTKRDQYFASLEFFDQYSKAIRSYGNIEQSLLKKVGMDYFSFSEIGKAQGEFETYKAQIEILLDKLGELCASTNLRIPLENEAIALFLDTFFDCYEETIYSGNLPAYLGLDSKDELFYCFDLAKETRKRRDSIKGDFDLPKAQLVDAERLIEEYHSASSIFAKAKWKKHTKKALRGATLEGKKISKNEYLPSLERILSYQQSYSKTQKEFSHFASFFPEPILNRLDQIEEMEEAFGVTFDFATSLKECEKLLGVDAKQFFIELNKSKDSSFQEKLNATLSSLEELQSTETRFFEKYRLDESLFGDKDTSKLDALMAMLEEGSQEGGTAKLVDIAHINGLMKPSLTPLTSPFIQAFLRDQMSLDEMSSVFEATFARELIRLYFENRLINDFHSQIFNRSLERYRKLIGSYSEMVVEEVIARASKNLTHGRINYKDSSPIGSLKKIVSNGGRGVSIRDVLIRYDALIRDYFPCFLMSPLSAAQYLSVDKDRPIKKFDLVLFDEASQIPVHEAVGPIARGNSLIIAGDPQQMPPTTYFTSEITLSGDDLDYQDASSLLDECLALDFPSIRLCYHYRSRHESLINFSNKNFYESNLHTFPSANKAAKALRFEKVALSEEKSDTRLSSDEIKAILKRIKLIYSKEENADKSLGIIVFNIKQKESLEKAMETYLEKDKALAEAIHKAEVASNDNLFIKSIENVQGDERDIIILCVGFRKSNAGRAVIVGPLASSGGERRLNVAITRSKRKMYVISTIDDEDFDDDQYISNKGAKMLKHFLSYAKGEEIILDRIKQEERLSKRDSISDFLRKDLERMGYLCDSNVGESQNKIDIAIRGENLDTYALGILIDDDEEVTSASLRDKEYVEPNVFNALKWKIIKVYALSYFKDKEAVLKRIVEALDKPFIKMEAKIEPILMQKEVSVDLRCEEYQKADFSHLGEITYSSERGFAPSLYNALEEIINKEGPVALSTIKNRVKENLHMMVLSATAQFYINRELAPFSFQKDRDGLYWPKGKTDHRLSFFRYGGERDITEIPYEEFVSCFDQILEMQGELSREDLFKATLEAFRYGSAKLTKKNCDYLSVIYARYKAER